MSIKDLQEKIKAPGTIKNLYIPRISDDIFYGLLVILVAFGSFGLGRLSKITEAEEPIRIENGVPYPKDGSLSTVPHSDSQSASLVGATSNDTQLVASKSGTKYHYLWCSGAKTISEANKIYFKSKAEAESSGYTPAANCKGL